MIWHIKTEICLVWIRIFKSFVAEQLQNGEQCPWPITHILNLDFLGNDLVVYNLNKYKYIF